MNGSILIDVLEAPIKFILRNEIIYVNICSVAQSITILVHLISESCHSIEHVIQSCL